MTLPVIELPVETPVVQDMPKKRRPWVLVIVVLIIGLIAGALAMVPGKSTVADSRDKARAELKATKADLRDANGELAKLRTERNKLQDDLDSSEDVADGLASVARICREAMVDADVVIDVSRQALDLDSQALEAINDTDISEMYRVTAEMKALSPQMESAVNDYTVSSAACEAMFDGESV
jgi:hypothetical protein